MGGRERGQADRLFLSSSSLLALHCDAAVVVVGRLRVDRYRGFVWQTERTIRAKVCSVLIVILLFPAVVYIGCWRQIESAVRQEEGSVGLLICCKGGE